MTQPAYEPDASQVLTLEEIGNLAPEGGKPAETLMNVVALIARRFQTDVCSAYLLEPDRANLVLAATAGTAPRVHRHAAHGAARRPGGTGGRTGAAGRRGAGERASALQVLQRGRRRRLPVVPGRAADRPRRAAGRAGGADGRTARSFREDEIRMLVEAAAQVAPVVSEARTLDRFIAPAQERLWSLARNLWWSWDNDSTSLFRDLDPVRWRQLQSQSDLAARRDSAGGARTARRRTGAAQPHQLRVPPPAGIPAGGPDLGRDARRASCGRVRWRIFRPSSDLHESLPVYSGGLGVLAGDHIKSASDLDIPLVGIGLFYGQGYFRQRLDANGWQQEEYLADRCQPAAHGAGHRDERRAGDGADRNAQRLDPRQGLARESGALRSAAARFQRGRQRAGRPRADFAAVWRRRPRSHPPGTAAGRGRLPRPEGHGDHAGRAAPERRAQRVRGAGSDPQPHGGRRPGLRPGRAAGFARSGLHHAHAGAGGARPVSTPT